VRDIEQLREEYQAGHMIRLEADGGSHSLNDSNGLDTMNARMDNVQGR